MKNRFVFIVGILSLTIIIWTTTMLAIKYNSPSEENTPQPAQTVFIENTANFY